MKHLITKLFFIAILVLGISSFVILKSNKVIPDQDEIGNTRFNSEMDNGFEEREARY